MNEQFEFKSAANGQISLDQAEGIVECFVAGIGNKDSVGDIVVTGAFAKSLTRRKPRVVWAHSWNDPIGKVLEMYEVPPGDPRLPAKMRNAGIGGLYAKVQFNLQSEKGKEAFASVAFFGEEQEWSIGYKTINGAFDPAQQANVLKEVELYEVSPVLHGANQLTGTISVKSEQKNHMMPIIAGMPMMGEQQQPRMIVIAAPEQEQEQDEPFNIFAEGLAQPLDADKVQKIQAELSERTGSKVDIVEATDSFIVFRRTTTDGKVSMYRVGYHTPDDYNTFMFGKPEAYSGNDNKPQIQQEIEVKPADASMVPMQPQQMPYRDDDQDEMNMMLGGQVGVGKSAYAHLIEIPQIHMVQAKSMLQPVFNYHKLLTTDSDNGIIVNGSISAQAIDALQNAVKAIGQTIGQSVGNLRTLAQSFNPFAIDGDNDGFAQDGTAFQRPYIPIKKPDMDLPEVGGKKRNSSELLDKPTIRTGKKPDKDPSLLQGQERQAALAAGELQPRTMDDISFLANRRPENEGLAKYWDMSEDGLRAEGQKLVAARRGQTGSAREATDGELFKISHEFARREAYKQQFGKDFVPPKRTESTGKETFDVRDVEIPNNLTRPGREFTGYNPFIERDKEKQRMAKLADEAIAEYVKNRSKRGFGSRGDVTPEQQSRIDAARRRGADLATGRGQILVDNVANLSDEDKDFIRENGIVAFMLEDRANGPLNEFDDTPADRIIDLLPEGDWSTDSGLQADAEDIFASYEEGFFGQLDREFADRVNPADLDTPKAKRDRQRAAGQGEMFDDFDSLSADEQDLILEQGRDMERGLASRNIDDYSDDAQSAYYEDKVNKKRVRELQEEFGWDRDEAEAALNNWYELDGVDADEFDREAGGDTNSAIYSAWETAQVEKENRSGFRSQGDETPELRPYDELTDKEKSDLYEQINNYLVRRNDTATIKNELEEGGFDYDDFLQKYPEFHPDSADYGDPGDMGFGSRGERYWGYPQSYDSVEQKEKHRKVREKLNEPVVRGEKSPMLSLQPFDSFSGYNGGGSQFVRKYEDSYDVTGAVREPIYQDDRAFQTQFADQIVKDFSRSDLTVAELADRFGITEAQVQDVLEDAAKQINDGMEKPPRWDSQKYRLEDVQNLFSGTRKHTDIPEPSKAVLDARASRREYAERFQKATEGNIAYNTAMNELRQTEKFKKAAAASNELKRRNADLIIPIVAEIKLREERAKLSGTEQENNLALLDTYFDGQEIMDLLEEAGIDYQKPEDAFYYDDDRDIYFDDDGEVRSIEDLWLDWFVEEEFTDEEKESLSQAIQKYTDRITNAAARNRKELGVGEKDDLKTIRKAMSDSEAEALKPVTEMADEVRKKYPFENTALIETPPQPSSLDGVRDEKGKFISPNELTKIRKRPTNDEDEGFASRGSSQDGELDSYGFGKPVKINRDDDWEMSRFDEIDRQSQQDFVAELEAEDYFADGDYDDADKLSLAADEWNGRGLEKRERYTDEMLGELYELENVADTFTDTERNGTDFEGNAFSYVEEIIKNPLSTDFSDYEEARKRMDSIRSSLRESVIDRDQSGSDDESGFASRYNMEYDPAYDAPEYDDAEVAELYDEEVLEWAADATLEDFMDLNYPSKYRNETEPPFTEEELTKLFNDGNFEDIVAMLPDQIADKHGDRFTERAQERLDDSYLSRQADAALDRYEAGFGSRGDSGSRTVQDFENLGNKYGASYFEDTDLYQRADELGKAKAELTAAIDNAENMLDELDEDSPEWERLFNAQQEMSFKLWEIEDMMEEMVTEKDRLDNAQSEAAQLTGEANDLVETRKGITRPSAEDLDELSFEDAHYEYTSLMRDINYLVDENDLSVDWSEEKQSEIEKALRDGDYEKAEDMLYDVTQEIWDAADDKYRTAEAEYDDYPFLDEDNGFASRGSSRFDTMETPYSSAIEAVHYDRDTRELHVAFKPGQTGGEARYYTYSDVSPDYFDNEISGSNSIGRVINDVKKNHDVEVTNPRTVDAINGRGEVASAPGKLGPWSTTRGSRTGAILAEGDDYYYTINPDGAGGYRASAYSKRSGSEVDRMGQYETLEAAKAWAGKDYATRTRATTSPSGRSEIQDIDVSRSAALYESYYDPNAEELVVTFKDKDGNAAGSYIYEGVTADEANELASASSKGKIINRLKASKSVRRAGADDRMTRTPGAADEVGAGGYEAQVDSHWSKIGPEEQQRYFARAVDSAINAGTGTSADEITADAKARAYDDRQIAMMEMQAEELGMGYRKIDVGSSAALNRVEYDPDKRELRVEYRGRDGKGNGEFYVYQNVPQSVVDDIEASDSRGATLRRVRDDFEFRTEPAIPESAFYSMGDASDNGRRNGRDGFASGGRLGAAPDDAEYGRELAAQRARDRAAGRNATNPIGRAEYTNSQFSREDLEKILDRFRQTPEFREWMEVQDELESRMRRFDSPRSRYPDLDKEEARLDKIANTARQQVIEELLAEGDISLRDVATPKPSSPFGIGRDGGLASRGSINESSTGQRIVPSRMHSDDREALAEITDPEERKQRIDELIEFYGPRIFAKPSKPKRKPSDYDEDGFLIENDGFASSSWSSKMNRGYPYYFFDEDELGEQSGFGGAIQRADYSTDNPEYEPSLMIMPWNSLSESRKKLMSDSILKKNREYFDKMWQDGASLGEIEKEIGKLHDEKAKAELISLERTLKMAKEDFYESARRRLEKANPSMSQNEIDDMLVDMGLSETDFDNLFRKNMDAFELASVATDLEKKRREIVAISTPKTGGDRPKVDPLSILGGYSDGDVFGLTPRGFASRGESGVKRKTKEDVFADMQKQLIDALEDPENLGKWKLPWRRTGMPENGATGKKYSGSNWFFLSVMSDIKGYDSNKWATYNQWQGLGGQVRKGEKGTQIFVPMFVKGKEKADGTMGEGKIIFKAATVFNLKQIDGMPADFDKKEILPEAERVSDLEKTISEIPAVIKNGGDRAFFQPSGDFIQVPNFENFNDARSYYSTVAHELMHWTGGKGRLDRGQMGAFGTPEYAYEELVAEIASAIFMSSHDIEPDIQENHGPYLASWLKALKQDPDALQRAMTDAQKAVNYVLDISPNAKSKFSHGEKAEFDTPEIAVVGDPVVAVEGFASRGDWPTPGGYEPSEFDMRTALSQIGRGNLMAISGTRAKKRNNEMVLPVNRNQQVIVGYDGGSDTYFVRAEQIITNGKDKGKTRVLGQWDNVYADELGETAYQASLKPSMLSDENKTVWAQAFDHPQTGSLLDENGQVYENGFASGGDSMDPDELDAMDWAYDAAQDYLMEQEDMMPDEPSPEDGFASRMNLSTPEKNEIISIARGMDTPFTRSVVAQYDRNGELSDRQWDALNRMTLRGNRRGFPSRGDEKRHRAPKAPWSPEDRQRFADRDRLRSKKRPGKRRNGPDASEYGFGSRGSDGRPSIDMIESDIFFEGERNGRSWGFEPIISIVAEQFGGRKNMSNRQLAKELGVSEAVAEKMRKPGARTSDIYLLDDLRVRVAGADRSIWGPNNDPLAYYDESGRPLLDYDEIPDVEDLAPDAPGTRAPKEGGARTYIDPTAVFEEVGIDANASKYSIVRDNSDVFNRRVWDRIMTRGITEDEINALLKARKSKKRSADIYTPEQLGAVKQKRTDSMPLADIFKNQAFDSVRGKRGFPQQVAEAITEITGRRPAISTVKAFINQPRSSGSQTGRNPFSMSPAQIRLLLDNLGISAEEFDKFRSE